MTGPDTVLVDAHSATNGRSITSSRDLHFVEPINCTHSEMVKFPHRKDSYYMTVAGHLKKIEEGIQRGKNGTVLLLTYEKEMGVDQYQEEFATH